MAEHDGIPLDLDGDGYAETMAYMTDSDQNGIAEQCDYLIDTDGDSVADKRIVLFDQDQNGIYEKQIVSEDLDDDGIADYMEVLCDTDQDGTIDLMLYGADTDGDGRIDSFFDQEGELWEASGEDGLPVEGMNHQEMLGFIEEHPQFDMPNYDPYSCDSNRVFGHPSDDVDQWEFQGETNRCALYSQKFVIEELTGREIDMDQFAGVAQQNGWFSETGGTPLQDLNRMLEYYGLESERHSNGSLDDIRECLADGGKVIAAVDADEYWEGHENDFLYGPSVNHAVEVIGVDDSDRSNPMVILNDSGHPDGAGMLVPAALFCGAWEDGGCEYVTAF